MSTGDLRASHHTSSGGISGAAASACYHCGAPNPVAKPWTMRIGGAERVFCCAGCLAVAQAIDTAGLNAFYRARTALASRPEIEARPEDWRRYDVAPNEWSRALADGKRETSLLVEGLTCGACVWLIERGLTQRAGIVAASVNYASRRGRVVFDPDMVRLSDILAQVAALGYRAYPYAPERSEALARRETRDLLVRTAIAWLAMMQVMMLALPAYVSGEGVAPAHQRLLDWASLVLTAPVIAYCAQPFFLGAWRDLRRLRAGMDVPIALGLGAAFVASAVATVRGTGSVYFDSVTMFVALVLCARYLEALARKRAGATIERLAKQLPATAERCARWPIARETEVVTASGLVPDDIVLVRAGAAVPADGIVLEGTSHVEEAVLTGEARPLARATGDRVLAGAINRENVLIVRVEAAGEATRLASIVRLTERAAAARPRIARLADRIAAGFVAALLALALGTAIVWWQIDPERALAVTFAVLVVSCPCALSLATPAAMTAAAHALARSGVVLARADALETLGRVTHVVFDKTGTLSDGHLRVVDVVTFDGSAANDALGRAAALEAFSEHPIAHAFRGFDDASRVVHAPRVIPGQGVEGRIEGTRWRVGRAEFVAELGPSQALPSLGANVAEAATWVLLGDERGIVARFACIDAPRSDARDTIRRLHELGVQTLLRSGDRLANVRAFAHRVGIAEADGDSTPEAKRSAIAQLQAQGAVVAMVGDGINDGPALAQAQVSLSFARATPLAQWSADAVVVSVGLSAVADTLTLARRARRVIAENLGWAAVYNAIAIPVAAFGFVTPLAASIGMSLSSLVVVSNALRLARPRTTKARASLAVPGLRNGSER